jgi:shikimate 5-dehydrogenase
MTITGTTRLYAILGDPLAKARTPDRFNALFAERGIDPQRLAVVGYGQYRPLQDNTSASGRNANRRVVVIIMGRGRNAGYASP